MSTTTDSKTETHPAGWRPEPKGPSRTPGIIAIAVVAAFGLRAGWRPLVVILSVVVMIFLHELGHFVTAKWAGMKVTEFFIGFGPKIWSFQRGETEYGLKVIPAGAYVRIIGMHNLEEVPDEDEDRTYRQKPYWRRMSVAVAGSTMHFIMALVCIFLVLVFHGRPGGMPLFPTEEQAKAADEALSTRPDWVVVVREDSPAAKAGLLTGDHLVSIDGRRVTNFESLRDLVGDRKGDTVPVVVERDGDELTLPVTFSAHPDDSSRAYLGVSPSFPTVDYGVVDAAGRTFVEFKNLAVGSIASIGKIFSPSGISDFAGQVADPSDDPTTAEPSPGSSPPTEDDNPPQERPVSIVGAVGIGADLLSTGWIGLVLFLALLNMFVGVFNLIPLLPLDGGHVAIATYERIRSRKGRPYHADIAKLLPLTYAVVLALILLGLATLYLDLVDPVNLPN